MGIGGEEKKQQNQPRPLLFYSNMNHKKLINLHSHTVNVEYGGNFHCTLFAMHHLKFSFGGEFLSLLDRYGTCDVRENGDLGNLDVGANEG